MTANTFTGTFRQIFADTVEELLGQFCTYEKLRGTEAHMALKKSKGNVYKYLTLTEGTAQDYTQYSDMTIDATTVGADTLTLTYKPAYTFNLDMYDEMTHQAAGSILSRQSQTAFKKMAEDLEGRFFLTGVTETSVNDFDDGNIGGSDGTSITWNTANIPKIFSEAKALVTVNSGMVSPCAMVITPGQLAEIEQSGYSNAFRNADSIFINGLKVGQNGYVGHLFGVEVFFSTFLPHSYTITYTGQPTTADPLTLNGLTYTAIGTIGTTAGNFLIAGSEDLTYANLVEIVNVNTTTANGVAQSAANQRIARKLWAVQDTTNDTVTVYNWGDWSTAATETLDNATIGVKTVHNYFGEFGAIEMANPMGIQSVVREEPKQPTDNFMTFTYVGYDVPANNLEKYIYMTVIA